MSCSRPGGAGRLSLRPHRRRSLRAAWRRACGPVDRLCRSGFRPHARRRLGLGESLSAFRRAGAGHGALDAAETGRPVCLGEEGRWLERSDGPFVPPAWTKTPTSAETITFAGAGRWSRAACATGTAGFCRKRAPIVRARWDSGSKTAASPLVCVQCQGVVRSLETPGGVASPGVLGVFSVLSRVFAQAVDSLPSAAGARCCAPRGCSGPRLARGAQARPPSFRASRPSLLARLGPGRRRIGASHWPRRPWVGGW